MALVDMKRTKADTAKNSGSIDDYPYGLHVSLDGPSLDKLGLDALPKVGDTMHLHAHAHVAEVSEHSRDGGKKSRRVELHLRKMELQPAKKETAAEGAKAAMDRVLPSDKDGDEK